MFATALLLAALTFQDSNREAVASAEHEYLSPRLRTAMDEVLRFDRRLLDLGVLNENGVPNPPTHLEQSQEIVQFLVNGEADFFPGRLGFAFGDEIPLFEQLLECGRHDRGIAAAEKLIELAPDLSTRDLLDALDDGFLKDIPIAGTQRARDLHEFALTQARLAPLGNGTIAYVIWGVLHLPEFWEDKPGEREEFITDLIELGSNSQYCGMAVERVLQGPLLPDAEKPGRGVAYFLLGLRQEVGFTRAHKKLLEEYIELVEDASKESGAGPNPFDVQILDSSTSGTDSVSSPTQLGHLRTWAPELLQWVLYELEPEQADALMRRSESMESRKAYWTALANTVSYEIFRALMLEEVSAMLKNLDENPLANRIAELESLQATGVLTKEQRRELRDLRLDLTFARRELISHISELSVLLGGEGDYQLAATTLAVDLHNLLDNEQLAIGSGSPGGVAEQLLQGAWISLSITANRELYSVLEQILQGDLNYPEYGTSWLLIMLEGYKLPGYENLLRGFIENGTPSQRSSALLNSGWLSPERYEIEIDRLFVDSQDPARSASDRAAAWDGAVHSLSARDTADGKELLIKSIKAGQWKGDAESASWVHTDSFFRKWALDQLSQEEKTQFVQQGLIDKALL